MRLILLLAICAVGCTRAVAESPIARERPVILHPDEWDAVYPASCCSLCPDVADDGQHCRVRQACMQDEKGRCVVGPPLDAGSK